MMTPRVVFEDRTLPHQITLRQASGQTAVSCSCLARQRGPGTGRSCGQHIAIGSPLPAAEAIAAWRAWHAWHGIKVSA